MTRHWHHLDVTVVGSAQILKGSDDTWRRLRADVIRVTDELPKMGSVLYQGAANEHAVILQQDCG